MNAPIACFVSRHKPTPAQRRDFAAYRVFQVAYRFFSVRQLWLDALFACNGAPEVLVLTFKNDELGYAVKYIQRLAPHTQIVRVLTTEDNETPSGIYCQLSYVPGRGLVARAWTPQKEGVTP